MINPDPKVLEGNGEAGCPLCYGRGALDTAIEGCKVPAVVDCICVRKRRVWDNCERAWPGVTKAARIKTTPLLKYTKRNVWITASEDALRVHLRHVGLRQSPRWGFRVYTDYDYMREWLRPLKDKGAEIYDADIAVADWRRLDSDIVEGPALLILRLGVKAARNNAMPEVLLEVLTRRDHAKKPTWVFDQPTAPLCHDHRCYSPDVADFLKGWQHLALTDVSGTTTASTTPPAMQHVAPIQPGGITGSAPQRSKPKTRGVSHVDLEVEENKPYKPYKKGWK